MFIPNKERNKTKLRQMSFSNLIKGDNLFVMLKVGKGVLHPTYSILR